MVGLRLFICSQLLEVSLLCDFFLLRLPILLSLSTILELYCVIRLITYAAQALTIVETRLFSR